MRGHEGSVRETMELKKDRNRKKGLMLPIGGQGREVNNFRKKRIFCLRGGIDP